MRHHRPGGRQQPPTINLSPVTKGVAAAVVLGFVVGLVSELHWLTFAYLHLAIIYLPDPWEYATNIGIRS